MTRLRRPEPAVRNRLDPAQPSSEVENPLVSTKSQVDLTNAMAAIAEAPGMQELCIAAVHALHVAHQDRNILFCFQDKIMCATGEDMSGEVEITTHAAQPLGLESGLYRLSDLPEGVRFQLLGNSATDTKLQRVMISATGVVSTVILIPDMPKESLSSQLQAILRAVHARAIAIRQLDEAQQMTTTDDLTGLANRRYFVNRLAEEIDRAKRHNRLLSLIILDLDNLKQLNDCLGHQCGDEALKDVATRLKLAVRRIDTVCRYAGDEFCIIMPDAGIETCQALLRRLHLALNLTPSAPDCPSNTISMGGAVFPVHAQGPEQLLRIADAALREAKRARGTFRLA